MELKKREEIIKGLECCLCDTIKGNLDCETLGCPYYKLDEDCISNIMTDALVLIKELTKEIKDLEEDHERVDEQAEADIHGNIAVGGTSCHWCMDKTRYDTVRKMQERLKELYTDEIITDDMTVAIGVIKQNIDDVAKEMLEEQS